MHPSAENREDFPTQLSPKLQKNKFKETPLMQHFLAKDFSKDIEGNSNNEDQRFLFDLLKTIQDFFKKEEYQAANIQKAISILQVATQKLWEAGPRRISLNNGKNGDNPSLTEYPLLGAAGWLRSINRDLVKILDINSIFDLGKNLSSSIKKLDSFDWINFYEKFAEKHKSTKKPFIQMPKFLHNLFNKSQLSPSTVVASSIGIEKKLEKVLLNRANDGYSEKNYLRDLLRTSENLLCAIKKMNSIIGMNIVDIKFKSDNESLNKKIFKDSNFQNSLKDTLRLWSKGYNNVKTAIQEQWFDPNHKPKIVIMFEKFTKNLEPILKPAFPEVFNQDPTNH